MSVFEPPKGRKLLGVPFFELWFAGLIVAALIGSFAAAWLVGLFR